jgi:hypothetical protein
MGARAPARSAARPSRPTAARSRSARTLAASRAASCETLGALDSARTVARSLESSRDADLPLAGVLRAGLRVLHRRRHELDDEPLARRLLLGLWGHKRRASHLAKHADVVSASAGALVVPHGSCSLAQIDPAPAEGARVGTRDIEQGPHGPGSIRHASVLKLLRRGVLHLQTDRQDVPRVGAGAGRPRHLAGLDAGSSLSAPTPACSRASDRRCSGRDPPRGAARRAHPPYHAVRH